MVFGAVVEFKGRSYRGYDKELMKKELLKESWDRFYALDDPNDAWEFILNRLYPILDKMCPIRTYNIKNYRPDWVTHELLEQIKDRDYYYTRAKESGDEDAWNIAKHLRNVTNANIRKARRAFVVDELQNSEKDYKRFWRTIRTVIPNEKGSSKQNITLVHEGMKFQKEEVAHYINDYFIGIGKSESMNVHGDREPETDGGTSENSWSFEEITKVDVLKTIQSINISKSLGLKHK